MKTFFAVAYLGVAMGQFFPNPYDCDGTMMKFEAFDAKNPDSETCCEPEAEPEPEAEAEPEASGWCFEYACKAGTVSNPANQMDQDATQERCCQEPTCGDAEYDSDWNQEVFHQCPTGEMFTFDIMSNGLTRNDENCCVPYMQDCTHASEERPWSGAFDLWPCPDGQILSSEKFPGGVQGSDEECCIPFDATCMDSINDWTKSGTPYACPTGFMPVAGFDAMMLSASDENCCVARVYDCTFIDESGSVYQCPEDKVLKIPADDIAGASPSDSKCCVDPTCENVRQTCLDLHELYGCDAGYQSKADAASISVAHKYQVVETLDRNLVHDQCCELAGGAFSGALQGSSTSFFVKVLVVASPLLLL